MGLLAVRQPSVQHRMCFLLSDVLPAEEKERGEQMLASVAASVVFPRGFLGFAVFAVGRGAAPDANGGQVVLRAGMCGSANTDSHTQTQTQCSCTGLCQPGMVGLFHKFEWTACSAQTALRLPRRALRLPAGAHV